MYCNVLKFSERQVWANIVDQDETAPDQSSLFAILSASFGGATLL